MYLLNEIRVWIEVMDCIRSSKAIKHVKFSKGNPKLIRWRILNVIFRMFQEKEVIFGNFKKIIYFDVLIIFLILIISITKLLLGTS